MPLDYEQLHKCYWCKVRGKTQSNPIQYYMQLTAPGIVGFQNRWACKDCMIDMVNRVQKIGWHVKTIALVSRKNYEWHCTKCYHPFFVFDVQSVAQCPYCGAIEWIIKKFNYRHSTTAGSVTVEQEALDLVKNICKQAEEVSTVPTFPKNWSMADPKNVLISWDSKPHKAGQRCQIPHGDGI